MLILIIIAVIVIPPDKLPEVARQFARFINDLKRNTGGIWDDIKRDAMLKPEDLFKYNPNKSPETYQQQQQMNAQNQANSPSDGHEPFLEETSGGPANTVAANTSASDKKTDKKDEPS